MSNFSDYARSADEEITINTKVRLYYYPRPGDELDQDDIKSIFKGIADLLNNRTHNVKEFKNKAK
ncbi:MAG: hypothetical protein J7J99_02570 [Thermoprotei archaeon]|nr:hypothetical protein [Thermoprotei archaeon]